MEGRGFQKILFLSVLRYINIFPNALYMFLSKGEPDRRAENIERHFSLSFLIQSSLKKYGGGESREENTGTDCKERERVILTSHQLSL